MLTFLWSSVMESSITLCYNRKKLNQHGGNFKSSLKSSFAACIKQCYIFCLIMRVFTFLDLICFKEASSWCSSCWSSLRDNESSCSPMRCLQASQHNLFMYSRQTVSKVRYLWLLCKASILALSLAYSWYQLPYVTFKKHQSLLNSSNWDSINVLTG